MDIKSLVIDFIIGGLLVASAIALANLIGPLFGVLFIIALYFSLPKFGLYKGFVISGTIFSIAVIIMIKLWP